MIPKNRRHTRRVQHWQRELLKTKKHFRDTEKAIRTMRKTFDV